MVKEYMIGTLADTPLLRVDIEGVNYFVDVKVKKVMKDDKGLTVITDSELKAVVLKKAKEL